MVVARLSEAAAAEDFPLACTRRDTHTHTQVPYEEEDLIRFGACRARAGAAREREGLTSNLADPDEDPTADLPLARAEDDDDIAGLRGSSSKGVGCEEWRDWMRGFQSQAAWAAASLWSAASFRFRAWLLVGFLAAFGFPFSHTLLASSSRPGPSSAFPFWEDTGSFLLRFFPS